MAQPQTLNRVMSPDDRLVVRCRRPGCDARYIATRDQAVKRYGPDATSYLIEHGSRCPACGGTDITAAITRSHDLASVPGRDEITAADVQRLGLRLSGVCAPCHHGVTPAGAPIEAVRLRPLATVFASRIIRCHKCQLPLCGLSVDRAARNGGGARETVHAWWTPGSPADPAVVEFWRDVRVALKRA